MPLEELERFSVSYLRILEDNGGVDKELEPELNDDQCIQLFRAMVVAREGDQFTAQLRFKQQATQGKLFILVPDESGKKTILVDLRAGNLNGESSEPTIAADSAADHWVGSPICVLPRADSAGDTLESMQARRTGR